MRFGARGFAAGRSRAKRARGSAPRTHGGFKGASAPLKPSKKRVKHRERAHDPLIGDALKQFYRLVHPDLLGRYPELREVNERSLGSLMGLLDDLKTASNDGEYPPARTEELLFYVRTDQVRGPARQPARQRPRR